PLPPVFLFPSTHHRLLNRVPTYSSRASGQVVYGSDQYCAKVQSQLTVLALCTTISEARVPRQTQALAGASSKFPRLPLEIRKEHGCLYLPGLLLSRGLYPSLLLSCAVLGCLRNLFFLLRVQMKISFSFGISYHLSPPTFLFSLQCTLPLLPLRHQSVACSLAARRTLTRPKFHHRESIPKTGHTQARIRQILCYLSP
ncbi:hypothetical protein CORC01_05894, partial [Colletotrichum orchidophilum]